MEAFNQPPFPQIATLSSKAAAFTSPINLEKKNFNRTEQSYNFHTDEQNLRNHPAATSAN